MAYFSNNEPYSQESSQSDVTEEEYDDGFDELIPEEDPDLTEEERAERKENRFRLAAGAGNLVAVIGGAVLILLLLTMIFSMVYYVINDMNRSFSLFSTNF